MATCLGKSCSFGLLCVPFVDIYQFVYVPLSLIGFEGGMWYLIVLVLIIGFLLTCQINLQCIVLSSRQI